MTRRRIAAAVFAAACALAYLGGPGVTLFAAAALGLLAVAIAFPDPPNPRPGMVAIAPRPPSPPAPPPERPGVHRVRFDVTRHDLVALDAIGSFPEAMRSATGDLRVEEWPDLDSSDTCYRVEVWASDAAWALRLMADRLDRAGLPYRNLHAETGTTTTRRNRT